MFIGLVYTTQLQHRHPKKMTILSSSVLWNPYDFLSTMERTHFQWIMTIVQFQPTVFLTQSHCVPSKYLKYCLWVFLELGSPHPYPMSLNARERQKTFLKTGMHYLGRKKKWIGFFLNLVKPLLLLLPFRFFFLVKNAALLQNISFCILESHHVLNDTRMSKRRQNPFKKWIHGLKPSIFHVWKPSRQEIIILVVCKHWTEVK